MFYRQAKTPGSFPELKLTQVLKMAGTKNTTARLLVHFQS